MIGPRRGRGGGAVARPRAHGAGLRRRRDRRRGGRHVAVAVGVAVVLGAPRRQGRARRPGQARARRRRAADGRRHRQQAGVHRGVAAVDRRDRPIDRPPSGARTLVLDQREQRVAHLGRVGEPIRAPLGERPLHDRAHPGRGDHRVPRGRILEDLRDQDRVHLGLERRPPRQRLEQHRADRVQIGAEIHVLAARLLGRHVQRRAHDDTRLRQPQIGPVADQPGEAEIEHLDLGLRGVAGDQVEVLGLDVAVDHARGVGRAERAQHVHAEVDRQRLVDRLPPQPAPHGLAVQALHHQERPAVGGEAEIEDLDHRGVVGRGRDPRLAQEALDHRRVGGEIGREPLEREAPAEQPVLHLVDIAHAARAELADDLVAIGDDLASPETR